MKLQINGDEKDFQDVHTLAELVEKLGMKQDRVAIELNREIVPRGAWSETTLAEGDRLEIVHFVGGGGEAVPSDAPSSTFYASTCPTTPRDG